MTHRDLALRRKRPAIRILQRYCDAELEEDMEVAWPVPPVVPPADLADRLIEYVKENALETSKFDTFGY